MNLLVTGGAGFIGSNFIRTVLQEKDVNIVNLDVLTYSGRLENLRDIMQDKRHLFVKGDIRDRKLIDRLIKKHGINVIFNFAAETHVDRSLVSAGSFISTDVQGTFVLLESARVNNVEKFIQVSTDEVYGSAILGRSFKEDDPLSPSSPYSASKASGDLLALAFCKSYGMNVMITRSSNNYGPYQYPEKFIPKMIIRAFQKIQLPIYGKGKQMRNWIHVLDNCHAIITVHKKGRRGEIYNIATNDEATNIEIGKTLVEYIGLPKSSIKFVQDRPGHDLRYAIDSTKIRNLGWRPKYRMKTALYEVIEWYKKNEWWWKPLINDEFVRSDTPWQRLL